VLRSVLGFRVSGIRWLGIKSAVHDIPVASAFGITLTTMVASAIQLTPGLVSDPTPERQEEGSPPPQHHDKQVVPSTHRPPV
jgi:hypothetical protein